MNDDKNPLMVVIWCFAYNQKAYIEECLKGFIKQKTTFRFEAVVHDDASTDGTKAIIEQYAEKYPDIIKPIFEEENQYSKHDGYYNRLMNSYTPSKYVAVCDGDDYWIDSNKLQKQFDLLESDPSISMCHHNFYQLYKDGRLELRKVTVPQRQNLQSLANFNNVQTLSMFFRNNPPLVPIEYECMDIYTSFWAMRLAEIGDIYYIDEPMAVYRFNEGGTYGLKNALQKFEMATSNIDLMISWYSKLGKNDVVKILKKRGQRASYRYIFHFAKNIELPSFVKVFKKFLKYC